MTIEEKYQKCLEFIKDFTKIDTLQSMSDVLKDEEYAKAAVRFLNSIGENV